MNKQEATLIQRETALRPLSPEEVAAGRLSDIKMATVLVGYLRNLRRGTAKTKTRGETRGGGRKPWRQKGTGRARAGSIRSPLWRGGGVIFGPTGKRRKIRFNRRERQEAFRALLWAKSRDQEVFIMKLEKPLIRTREALLFLGELLTKGKRILIVLPAAQTQESGRAFRNLVGVTVKDASSLNVLDLARYPYLILEETVWKRLQS